MLYFSMYLIGFLFSLGVLILNLKLGRFLFVNVSAVTSKINEGYSGWLVIYYGFLSSVVREGCFMLPFVRKNVLFILNPHCIHTSISISPFSFRTSLNLYFTLFMMSFPTLALKSFNITGFSCEGYFQ